MEVKKECKHEEDYSSSELSFNGEEEIVEEVKCSTCGKRGWRTFEFVKEEWE